MDVIGQFRFALNPGADEQRFLDLMRKDVFASLQPTRITRSFDHALLKAPATGQYVWQARVDLMTDRGYNFDEHTPRVQELVKTDAVLMGVEVFENIG
jgi:hypothetical protein